MTYSKNGRMISVEMQDYLGGKRPGLYIGTPGYLLKVASFGSDEKAKKFEEWFEYFLGLEKGDGKSAERSGID